MWEKRPIPCRRRAFSYEDDGDGDRQLIHGNPSESMGEDNPPSTVEVPELCTKTPIPIIYSYFGVDNQEDVPYMEKSIKVYSATQESTQHDREDSKFPRTYDISITYDKDHETPHFWLTTYHEDGMHLQPELILEDVRQKHAGKTVNIEDHPYLPGKHASVHPKIHRAAVKKMVDAWMSRGIVLGVDKYLFLFLEFVASVFPTIKYDCNCKMDFDLESCSS